MGNDDISVLFLEFSREKLLNQYWPRLRSCVESLSDEQVWWRPNDASNSIGNLMLHLNGNVQQWLVAPFDGSEDRRNRPAEFAERQIVPVAALVDTLDGTLRRASEVLSTLTGADLRKTFHSGLHRHRPSRGLPGRGALRPALRPDPLPHPVDARRRYGS